MQKLTNNQKNKIHAWFKIISFSPQFEAPLWLLKILDKKLPSTCPFEKIYWYEDILVLYIPSLCPLNPFYKSLFYYRLKAIEEINFVRKK